MTQKGRPASVYRVGEQVRIRHGWPGLVGRVIEDHGALGVGGRHLYRVEVPMDPFDEMEVEVSEEDIEPYEQKEESQAPFPSSKVMEYLIHGGLVSILQTNISGGNNPPRVWLRPDTLGNVTHTFVAERGTVGGEAVPFGALHGSKIYTPKRDEVFSFLRSFGLTACEAEQVLHSVGTAP